MRRLIAKIATTAKIAKINNPGDFWQFWQSWVVGSFGLPQHPSPVLLSKHEGSRMRGAHARSR